MHYFALGTTLASMSNIETIVTIPAHILEDGAAALSGSVATRVGSGVSRRDGYIFHNWRLDLAYRTEFNALIKALTGAHFTAQSRSLYISTIDETGHYSPFLCVVDKPYPQEHYRLRNGGFIDALVVPFARLRLQSVTKTANYSITTADRLVYGNTASGNITLTLPAAASVVANTVYSIEKTAAANTLTIDGNGSETVNGAANVTLTAVDSRYDLISDGTAWTSVTA